MKNPFSKKKDEKSFGKYYSDSTQKWLPIETVTGGLVLLKDGRYIKILEVLPVNFYLKSDVEQENIIYYFASYLMVVSLILPYEVSFFNCPFLTDLCIRYCATYLGRMHDPLLPTDTSSYRYLTMN